MSNSNIFAKLILLFNSQKIKEFFYLIIIIIINFIFEALQAFDIFPLEWKFIISNLQIITLLYACYKYLFKGFMISIFFNILNALNVYYKYILSSEALYVEIASYRIATIALSGLIYLLALRQKKYINKLEYNTYLDGITEVFNHKYFHERLEIEFLKATRMNTNLGIIMLGIDNFKKFNEKYGHRAGDELLKETAKVIDSALKIQDILCRYDGDIFSIILTCFNIDEITSNCEKIKSEYTKFINEYKDSEKLNISLSFGFSIYPAIAFSKDELISQADNALYNAKQVGRNNIKVYKDVFSDISNVLDANESQLIASLKTLLGTVSAKDRYTLGHSERVMEYSLKIAELMGFNEQELKVLRISALLHDVGKVEIPQAILNKKGKLTSDEFEVIKLHPVYSAEIVEPLASLGKIRNIVRHHHERIDGTGYPDGISGESIPLEARILAVADSFDAMMSTRPYRRPLTLVETTEELKKCANKQFDTKIVNVLLEILNKENNL